MHNFHEGIKEMFRAEKLLPALTAYLKFAQGLRAV